MLPIITPRTTGAKGGRAMRIAGSIRLFSSGSKVQGCRPPRTKLPANLVTKNNKRNSGFLGRAGSLLSFADIAEEDDHRRGAHRGILAGKGELSRFSIDAESSDRIAPLITRVKEVPRGVDIKAAWIIASRPCLPGK